MKGEAAWRRALAEPAHVVVSRLLAVDEVGKAVLYLLFHLLGRLLAICAVVARRHEVLRVAGQPFGERLLSFVVVLNVGVVAERRQDLRFVRLALHCGTGNALGAIRLALALPHHHGPPHLAQLNQPPRPFQRTCVTRAPLEPQVDTNLKEAPALGDGPNFK